MQSTPQSSDEAISDDPSFSTILKDLSRELTYNYFCSAFGDKYVQTVPERKKMAEAIFDPSFAAEIDERLTTNRYCRNILVIGAGATYDSYKAIPMGNEAVRLIRSDLGIDSLKTPKDDSAVRSGNKTTLNAYLAAKLEEETNSIKLKLSLEENKPLDFENYLAMYSRFFRENDVRNLLGDYYSIRHCPSLFYEIVAHLFKHSFIDVIINFNFDELLETVLDEEIGKDYYYSVLSDGDCRPLDEMLVDGRLKVPVYIKPHGTASHKTSLRFTKDQYLDIPNEIEVLLGALLSGQTGEDRHVDKINLISVGFNMASIEFNRLIETHLPRPSGQSVSPDSQVFYFNIEGKPPRQFACIKPENQKEAIALGANHLTKNLPFITPLGEGFRLLWKNVRDNFRDNTKLGQPVGKYIEPQGIARHELISYLFYDWKAFGEEPDTDQLPLSADKAREQRNKLKKAYDSVAHFQDRLLVEFAIALARNNGILELKEILKTGRIGLYYEYYVRKIDELNKRHQRNSNGQKQNQIPLVSLYRFAQAFKLQEKLSISRNLLSLHLPEPGKFQKAITIAYDGAINATEQYFYERLLNQLGSVDSCSPYHLMSVALLFYLFSSDLLSDAFKERFVRLMGAKEDNTIHDRDGPQKFIFKILERLSSLNRASAYYEIVPAFYDRSLFIFESITKESVLHTDLSVKYMFNSILMDTSQWDVLLLVSERANPVKQLNIKETEPTDTTQQKMIYAICCQEAVDLANGKRPEELLMRGGEQHPDAKLKVRYLPYWQHQHHMAVFLKRLPAPKDFKGKYATYRNQKQDELWAYTGTIYFYKEGFANTINPLFIGRFSKQFGLPGSEREKIERDQRMLLETFYAYWLKARTFEEGRKAGNDIIPSLSHETVQNGLEDWLTNLYEEFTPM